MKVSEALKLYGKNGPILVRDKYGAEYYIYHDPSPGACQWVLTIYRGEIGKIDDTHCDGTSWELIDWFEHPPTVTCTIPHACQYDLITDMCSICGFRQVTQSVSGEYSVRVTTTTAKTETNNKCTCDFHTVILRTGCQCGGV